MTTKIEGIIKPDIGQGFTLENYKVIISEIAKHFDGVKNCGKYGTINVTSLKPPLRKSFADYWTPRIRWKPIMGIKPERHEMYGDSSRSTLNAHRRVKLTKLGLLCRKDTPSVTMKIKASRLY